MEKTYKYRFSRRAIYWTLVYLVVFVLLGWLLYHLYEGGYLSACSPRSSWRSSP